MLISFKICVRIDSRYKTWAFPGQMVTPNEELKKKENSQVTYKKPGIFSTINNYNCFITKYKPQKDYMGLGGLRLTSPKNYLYLVLILNYYFYPMFYIKLEPILHNIKIFL